MNRVQQACVWLSRIAHSRGFGIQSPTDYRFVRYVVNEHWPYYAYATLPRQGDWLQRKLGRLYFRLANYLQPETAFDGVGASDYLRAGCRKTHIATQPTPEAGLLIVPACTDMPKVLGACGTHSVLVVQDIGRHSEAWQTVTGNPQTVVSFDLYYCGIAFFDPARSPQHYIVNF